jgi:hypothetical protein
LCGKVIIIARHPLSDKFIHAFPYFSDTKTTNVQELDENGWTIDGNVRRSATGTPSNAVVSMQNVVKVKFDPPKVPVIFVLGDNGGFLQ